MAQHKTLKILWNVIVLSCFLTFILQNIYSIIFKELLRAPVPDTVLDAG